MFLFHLFCEMKNDTTKTFCEIIYEFGGEFSQCLHLFGYMIFTKNQIKKFFLSFPLKLRYSGLVPQLKAITFT